MSARAMPGDVILSIENVAVHFGGLVAISDLNFTVCDGEIVGLIGPNGAGKTTAFNVFTGFLKPTGGEVRYRGTLLNGLKPHEIAGLGLVRTFQRTSVFQNNSVYENVLIGLHRRGRSTPWDTLLALPREKIAEREFANKAREILTLVGLESRAAELAGALPYGEQRLLGIALALAAQPSMLLLDEPVSGMNPSNPPGHEAGRDHSCVRRAILLVGTTCRWSCGYPTASSSSTTVASSRRLAGRNSKAPGRHPRLFGRKKRA
jgi:branched-chain amino acid transport system ATP-binding protein